MSSRHCSGFGKRNSSKFSPKQTPAASVPEQEDIDTIRRIYDLVKVQGLTLEGARKSLIARKGEAKQRGQLAMQAAQAAVVAQVPQVEMDFSAGDRDEAIRKLKQIRQKLLEARASLQESGDS